jgi:AhpD family alkylhydroperoxidase
VTVGSRPQWHLALLPALLRFPVDLARVALTVSGQPLSNTLRERIMLNITGDNECAFCGVVHQRLGAVSGLRPDEITGALAGDLSAAPQSDQIAVFFARDLARRGFEGADDALQTELSRHFDAHQRRAIEATARVIDLVNRVSNTAAAARARLTGRSDHKASLADLISGTLLFVAVAAVMGPLTVAATIVDRRR